MKLKLLRQLIRMSTYLFYGIFLQCLFMGLLLAKESEGQSNRKSLKDIMVSIEADSQRLPEVLTDISDQSGLYFNYHAHNITKNKVSLSYKNEPLIYVLEEIARQTGLGFKRVNEVVAVNYKQERSYQKPVSEEVYELVKQVKISGKVMAAEDNEPLPGVSILIKGTAQGTTTDIDGNYSISAPEGTILQFSYIGFITQEITVGSQTNINISLQSDLEQLEEVVVVGYGTQKKSDLTSAISSVKAEDIVQRVTPRLEEALQGQMAGVSVQQASGVPGAAPLIRIRGVGTTGGNAPLFVVDGFPVDNNEIIGNLNMNDVASIEVLKDAASAAIYGSRGANGVVLITTKKGGAGKLKVNINSLYGFQEGERFLEFVEGTDYGLLLFDQRNRLWEAQGGNRGDPNDVRPRNRRVDPGWVTGESLFESGQDYIYQTAPMQNHSVSLSGGNGKTSFFTSIDYLEQEGIVRGTGFERFSGRMNIESKLSDKVTVGINLATSYSQTIDRNTEGKDRGLDKIMVMGPIVDYDAVYWNQDIGFITTDYSAEYDLGVKWHGAGILDLIQNKQIARKPQITANTFVNVEIMKGLNFRSSLGAIYDGFHQEGNRNNESTFGNATAERQNSWGVNWLSENTINYSKDIGDHSFSVLAGYTVQKDYRRWQRVTLGGFPNDFALTFNNATELFGDNAANELVNENALLSALGRVTYGYKDKYLFTASMRRDGSSRFGRNNRWGVFPSLSGAWRISEESFLENNNVISNLKLRASWGVTGNNQIGNYSSLATVRTADAVLGDSEEIQAGILANGFANTELGWQRTEATNFGIDLGFVEDRFNLSFEVYNNKTTDLLFTEPLPLITGFGGFLNNSGEVRNRGFEIEVLTR